MDDKLVRLLELLDATPTERVGTSIRLPIELRQAAVLVAELGYSDSTTDLTVQGLREVIEAIARQAVFEAHYLEYPHARPSLGEVALAAAQFDGSALAQHPEIIERAVRDVQRLRSAATPDDVLMYAAGMLAAAA